MENDPRKRLREAIAAVPGDDLRATLAEAARAMPVPLGFDVVGIRLRGSDGAVVRMERERPASARTDRN